MATARPVRLLTTEEYVCVRCGIVKACNGAHAKPTRCADCRSVECVQGHLLTDSDAYRNSRGHLVCRVCVRESVRRRRATGLVA